jgi:hypothetical protein
MDHQTPPVSGSSRPARDLREHMASMARNINRIAELQTQLLAADLGRARATMVAGVSCWSAALALTVAFLPVAIGGLGLWLSDVTRLTPAGGLLTAAGAFAVVAAVLGVIGWNQFRKQRDLWRTSLGELGRNLAAVREALLNAASSDTSDIT